MCPFFWKNLKLSIDFFLLHIFFQSVTTLYVLVRIKQKWSQLIYFRLDPRLWLNTQHTARRRGGYRFESRLVLGGLILSQKQAELITKHIFKKDFQSKIYFVDFLILVYSNKFDSRKEGIAYITYAQARKTWEIWDISL